MRPMTNRLPTGPGSRGGRWHLPEFRSEWWRAYRRTHPEGQAIRRARVTEVGGVALMDVLRVLVRDEAATSSYRQVALAVALEHTTMLRFMHGRSMIGGDTVDALVDHFGLDAVIREFRAQGRAARRLRSTSEPTGNVPPAPEVAA